MCFSYVCQDQCISITRAKFVSTLKQYGSKIFADVRHVIVDEAQKFENKGEEDWLGSILTILNRTEITDQDTSLYIFFDELQKIRRKPQLHLDKFPIQPTWCELTLVIRNSKRIYEKWNTIALQLSDHQKKIQLAHDYEGRGVHTLTLSGYDEKEFFSNVQKEIDRVLEDNSYQPSDLAILFNEVEIAARFRKHLGVNSNLRVHDAEEFPRQGLVVDSFRRFSGLEAPVVMAVAPVTYTYFEHQGKVDILLFSRAMIEFYLIKWDQIA